ncbi:MAG: TonB-dependent receptor [Acidobacteriales bacterium]|nr:TonB-dependent receptor [Terriglobales bacterium]
MSVGCVGLAVLARAQSGNHLSGVVKDESGAVVQAAEVTVEAGKYRATNFTSDQGEFRFEDLPAGQATLWVRAANFREAERELTLPTGEPVIIILVAAASPVQIVVTASRVPEDPQQIAEQVIVRERQDLLATAAPTLDDSLRQVPGFTLFRRSGSRTANPTSQGVSMRGVGASGASRAVVVRDGIPLNDPFGGWVYWGRVPRESIQSVEVLSGGASHLYGTDALGGVVNVIPVKPASSALALETYMGTETTLGISMLGSLRRGAWVAALNGDVFATNGYTAVEPSARGLVDTPVASRHGSVALSVDRLSGNSRAFFSGSFYRESRDNGTPLQVNETEMFDLSTGADRSSATGLLSARLYGSGETFLQDFSAIAVDRNSESLTRKQHVPAQQLGASLQWSRTLGTVHMLGLGAESREIRGLSDELVFAAGSAIADTGAGGRQRTIGLFVHDSMRLHPRFNLTAGARFDFWRNYDAFSGRIPMGAGATSFTAFADRDEGSFSPRMSLLFRASENVAFTASGYRAFRAPTLNELYRGFRVGNIMTNANENLRAEHLAGGEGGVRFTAGKARLNSVFFWTIVTGAIANRTLSVTPALITRQRQNLGRTQSRGLDVNVELPISSRWALSAGYEFADATILRFAADPSLEGLLIPQTPRHSFTLQTRYAQPAGWTLALQARASGEQFEDDQNQLPLDGYATFDAFVSRRLNSNVELFAAGENLLNRRYTIGRTPVVTLGQPIVARFGLRLNFAQR